MKFGDLDDFWPTEKNPKFFNKLKNEFNEQILVDSGLFYLDEKKKTYVERFRGRLIFPINNISGQSIALGGRIIEELDYFFGSELMSIIETVKEEITPSKVTITDDDYADKVDTFVDNMVANDDNVFTHDSEGC